MHRAGPSSAEAGKVGDKRPGAQTAPAGGEGSGPTPSRLRGARRFIETPEGKTRYVEYGANDVTSMVHHCHSLLAAHAAFQPRRTPLHKGGFDLQTTFEDDAVSSAGGA